MRYSLLIAIMACLTGCGLIAHGTSQRILCTTTPAGALVKMADGAACKTPCSVTLSRKKDGILTIEREGYETTILPVHSVLSKSSAGEILLPGGLVCWGIDVASGGAYRLVPEHVDVTLKPAGTTGP
jgi:hypothetical protein